MANKRPDGQVPRFAQVVTGLRESGRSDLAAELNWATIQEFHGHYRAYVIPSSGAGGGVKRFAVSAAHYIQAVVDNLFGVDFDAIEQRVSLTPHVPKALYDQDLTLENLILPTQGNTRLSVRVKQRTAQSATISVQISGDLPAGSIHITLPGSAKRVTVPAQRAITADFP